MKPGGPYFYHFRIGHGITFAYMITEDQNVKFSYAICSSKDQFCKETGRDIAESRLFHDRQTKTHSFHIKPTTRFFILRDMCSRFLVDINLEFPYVKAPSWLKEISKNGYNVIENMFPLNEESIAV